MQVGAYDFGEVDMNFAKHEEMILRGEVFGKRFRKVIVSIESPAFVMMPNVLYSEDKTLQVLSVAGIKVGKNDSVLRNEIDAAGATTLFAIPNFLFYFLKTQFANPVILHGTTPVVSSMLLKRLSDKAETVVNVTLSEGCMTLVATERNELKLCNRFYCNDVNDYAYLTLFAMNQLGFDAAKTAVVVDGNIEEDDARVKTLRKFIVSVSLARLPEYFNYSFERPEDTHKFHSLFLMPLCVL